jgi:hypothetical protein
MDSPRAWRAWSTITRSYPRTRVTYQALMPAGRRKYTAAVVRQWTLTIALLAEAIGGGTTPTNREGEPSHTSCQSAHGCDGGHARS